MNRCFKILLLPGDGIGPEVMDEGLKVIRAIEGKTDLHFDIETGLIGGSSIDKTGLPIEDETLKRANMMDAVIMGAVGGTKWESLPFDKRPERGLLAIRSSMGVFANIRPVKIFEPLIDASPLKENVVRGTDIMIFRELTGGIYFGEPRGKFLDNGVRKGINTEVYSETEVTRIAEIAFKTAQKRRRKVTSVDKANVLESSEVWREIVSEVGRKYPDVSLEHMYVDNCSMQILRRPGDFDIILTTNLFGDIISDEAAMLTGSIGMLPSCSIGFKKAGLYEPVHGSAPDIAGRGIANPIAMILTIGMMMRFSLGQENLANLIEMAVDNILKKGYRTEDISSYSRGKKKIKVLKTKEMGDIIVDELVGLMR